jgi:hypothetical protein
MPKFEIEQYELHTMKYQVEADDKAHAIKRVFDGEADAVDDSLEYIEVAEDFGLPVDKHSDLAGRLCALGVDVAADVIPSIRSIEHIGDK